MSVLPHLCRPARRLGAGPQVRQTEDRAGPRGRSRLPAAGRPARTSGSSRWALWFAVAVTLWTGSSTCATRASSSPAPTRLRTTASAATLPDPARGGEACGRRSSPSVPSSCSARSSTPTRPGSASSSPLSGIDCNYQTRVGDNVERIASALRTALSRNEAVVICGGLGPTQDDLTREAIAVVMNVPLRRDDAVLQAIKALFASRRPGRTMPPNNVRQADVPDGASVIPQTMGTAPGLICPVGNKVIYAVPGVPYEMREMLERAVLPDLRSRAGEASVIRSRTLRTWGLAESGLAEVVAGRVEALEAGGPGVPTIAFLASGIEGIKVRLTVKAPDEASAGRALDAEEAELRALLGETVFGLDEETMETAVGRLLMERGWSLGVAESLTGGLIAARVVAVPGASDWFRGARRRLRLGRQAVAARRPGRTGRDRGGGGGDGRGGEAGCLAPRLVWRRPASPARPSRKAGPWGPSSWAWPCPGRSPVRSSSACRGTGRWSASWRRSRPSMRSGAGCARSSCRRRERQKRRIARGFARLESCPSRARVGSSVLESCRAG